MTQNLRYLVVTPTRNEGPFLLEWVAWYKMLGFGDILVLSNDCTDHSPQMLELLARHGWLAHQPHLPDAGKPAFNSAFRAARSHPLVASADWMLICDIDEFLVFKGGDGTVQGFIGDEPPDVAGIAIHWKTFGTSGRQIWQDGLVHRLFTKAAPKDHDANLFFKSLVHKPRRFRRFMSHSPKRFRGEWGSPPNVWINSAGELLNDFVPGKDPIQRTDPELVSHSNAQINHYIIRTRENYSHKMGQLSASSRTDRYTNRFLEKYNRNEEPDTCAERYRAAFDDIHRQIKSIPGIMRLHHLCCADYITAMCEKRGDDPLSDPRVIAHLASAKQAAT